MNLKRLYKKPFSEYSQSFLDLHSDSGPYGLGNLVRSYEDWGSILS